VPVTITYSPRSLDDTDERSAKLFQFLFSFIQERPGPRFVCDIASNITLNSYSLQEQNIIVHSKRCGVDGTKEVLGKSNLEL
jgi:hypothetical protein